MSIWQALSPLPQKPDFGMAECPNGAGTHAWHLPKALLTRTSLPFTCILLGVIMACELYPNEAHSWEIQYPAFGFSAEAVRVDSNDDVIVAGGSCLNYNGGPAVVKLDGRTGAERWRHWPLLNFSCGYEQVAIDSADDVFLSSRYSVEKRSGSSGQLLWGWGASPPAESIAVDPAGDVVWAGEGLTVTKLRGVDGLEVWRASPPTAGTPGGVAADANGDITVVGHVGVRTEQYQTYYALTVAKFSGGNGQLLWQWVNPAEDPNQRASAVTIDLDGNTVVAGSINGFLAACKLSPGGALLWCRALPGEEIRTPWAPAACQQQPTPMAHGSSAYSVTTSSSGDVIAAGYKRYRIDCVTSDDLFATRLDSATGDETWAPWLLPPDPLANLFVPNRFVTGAGSYWGEALAVAVDSSDDILAAGRYPSPVHDSNFPSGFSAVKVTKPYGTKAWEYHFPNHPGYATGVAVDSHDDVIVVGATTPLPRQLYDRRFTVVKLRGSDGSDFSLCGNGTLDPGEQCDDGNNVDGDSCPAGCVARCGDGALDADEECDDGNTTSGDGCYLCRSECPAGSPSNRVELSLVAVAAPDRRKTVAVDLATVCGLWTFSRAAYTKDGTPKDPVSVLFFGDGHHKNIENRMKTCHTCPDGICGLVCTRRGRKWISHSPFLDPPSPNYEATPFFWCDWAEEEQWVLMGNAGDRRLAWRKVGRELQKREDQCVGFLETATRDHMRLFGSRRHRQMGWWSVGTPHREAFPDHSPPTSWGAARDVYVGSWIRNTAGFDPAVWFSRPLQVGFPTDQYQGVHFDGVVYVIGVDFDSDFR